MYSFILFLRLRFFCWLFSWLEGWVRCRNFASDQTDVEVADTITDASLVMKTGFLTLPEIDATLVFAWCSGNGGDKCENFSYFHL